MSITRKPPIAAGRRPLNVRGITGVPKIIGELVHQRIGASFAHSVTRPIGKMSSCRVAKFCVPYWGELQHRPTKHGGGVAHCRTDPGSPKPSQGRGLNTTCGAPFSSHLEVLAPASVHHKARLGIALRRWLRLRNAVLVHHCRTQLAANFWPAVVMGPDPSGPERWSRFARKGDLSPSTE